MDISQLSFEQFQEHYSTEGSVSTIYINQNGLKDFAALVVSIVMFM